VKGVHSSRARLALAGVLSTVLANAGPAFAHDARPLSIFIVEQAAGAYRVEMRMPPSVESDNRPQLSWPTGCLVQSRGARAGIDAITETMIVRCASRLDGRQIGVQYALFNPSLATLFRFTPASGGTRTAVLPPESSTWEVPAVSNWRAVAVSYFRLGVEHIWAGVDHLLFVAGLLLLAGTPRRILVAITGFTLAHSVTLTLSTLDVVQVPSPPIEAGIALSILFVAREVAQPDSESIARRFPLTVASLFGLLHGFGFASALSEAGLPQGEIPAALLFFNVGVEAGQVVFIVLLLALIPVARRILLTWWPAGRGLLLEKGELVAAYVLGLPAALWFFQRLDRF